MRYDTKKEQRTRRHLRIGKKVSGTAERPRLAVSFSLKHAQAQLIDDDAGKTILAVSSLSKEFGDAPMKGMEKAKKLGEMAAQKAVQAGITRVVFDRGGFKYHGKVKELADAARRGGLQF